MCSEYSLLSPKNLTYDHVMNIERLITNATVVGSPVRAEGGIWVMLDIFRQVQAILWSGSTS